jgi:hypothetical protein
MAGNPNDMPAFPSQHLAENGLPAPVGWEGMTLRDWFAGQALAGMVAAEGTEITEAKMDRTMRAVAAISYLVADAMLKAREAKL